MIHDQDRRLLDGVLALQRGLISKEQFSEAIAIWLSDMSQSLSGVLVAKGMLTREQLSSLVNAEEDIAAATRADEEIEATLQLMGTGGAAPKQQANESPRRYVFIRAYAQGGLGKVSIAIDSELNRLVALKEILPNRADDPESQRRFLAEGEITGQLEHPGIVPVYGLGADKNGSPYYAMRFVKGENFKQAIERFHAQRGPHEKLSGQRALELRSLLGRFVDVCNAIEYAHSRKVLHRDLKPENILLGRYGETLVVDWGLAKWVGDQSLSKEGKAATTAIQLRSGRGSDTIDGEAMGTPAYMSPEQADGNIQLLSRSTDIYSLGATLSALLTGAPPIKADNVHETLNKVRRNEIVQPRQEWPAIPRPLEAICLKAMSQHPWARYHSARELGEDIEKWLADEPVQAYVEPLSAKAKRWIKRHPVVVSTTTACALLALIAALGIAFLQGEHARQLKQKNLDLAIANSKEMQARQEEEIARKDADDKRTRAEAATDFLVNIFRRRNPFQVGAALTMADSLTQARADLDSEKGIDQDDKARILGALSEAFYGLGHSAEELEAARKAHEILLSVVGPDHPRTLSAQRDLAAALSHAGEQATAIALLEKTLTAQKTLHGETHRETLATKFHLGGAWIKAGKLELALPTLEETLKQTREHCGEDDFLTVAIRAQVGVAYLEAARPSDAIEHFKAVYASERKLHGDDHASTIAAMRNLATAYQEARQVDLAMPIFLSASAALKSKIGAEHPTTLTAQNELAAAYNDAGMFKEAIALHKETLEIRKRKLGPEHADTLTSQNNLAVAYQNDGQFAESIPLLEAAFHIESIAQGRDHPETLKTQNNLALAYRKEHRLDLAIPLLEGGYRALCEKSGPDHFNSLIAGGNLALFYGDVNRLDEAIELQTKIHADMKRTQGENHESTLEALYSLAGFYFQADRVNEGEPLLEDYVTRTRGVAGDDLGKLRDSLLSAAQQFVNYKRFDKAESIIRDVVARHQEKEPTELGTFFCIYKLGDALNAQSKREEAIAQYAEAFAGAEKYDGPEKDRRKARMLQSARKIADLYDELVSPVDAQKWRAKILQIESEAAP